jgi:hypothetical protein
MVLTDIFKGETWGVIRAKLNAAIGQVNTHITTIIEIDTKASTAAADASTALSTAQTADAKAGTALTNAATADSKAVAAQTTATSALTAANNADTKAQSVVDALPTKVDNTDVRLTDSRTPTAHSHPASEITSGTLADARLSSNVALKNGVNFFTAYQTIIASGAGLVTKRASDAVNPFTINTDGRQEYGDGVNARDTFKYRSAPGVLKTDGTSEANQFRIKTNGPILASGTGSPEGVLTAVVGSTYARTDGSTNTARYIKETGVGNTGWIAK